jgi:ABC-type phosphate transport system permease subunit
VVQLQRRSTRVVSSLWLFVMFTPYIITTKREFIRVFVVPNKVRKTAYKYW